MTKFTFLVLLGLSLIALPGCKEKQPLKKESVLSPKVGSFEEIIGKSNCLACHQDGNQMKAPTWREVAEKYKGNKNAEDFLMKKIPHGGSGTWGTMDMPPFPELSRPEVRVIAQGILATSPQSR